MTRSPLTFVLAPNHRYFRQWCSDNRKNPNDPNLVIVTNVDGCLRRLNGHRWQEGDEVVELWPGRYDSFDKGLYEEWISQKRRMGCPDV